MKARSALLALFVALTVVLASTTVYESGIRTTVTSTSTSTATVYSVEHDYGLNLPWESAIFMQLPNKYCSAVCFGGTLTGAIIFPCTNATASAGCSVTVYDSFVEANYSFVAQYPVYNQANEFSVDNCEFNAFVGVISYTPVPGSQGFGYCAWIGPDDFVVAQEMPGPA